MRNTNEQAPIRERWTARAPGAGDEATAGGLLRLAARPGPIGEKQLAEIGARLRNEERARARLAARPGRRFVRQLAVSLGLILFGGALSASVSHVLHEAPVGPTTGAATTAIPRSKPVRRSSATRTNPAAPTAPTVLEPPAADPPDMPSPAAPMPAAANLPRPGRLLAVRETSGREVPRPFAPAPDTALAPAPGPSELARESRLLASAIAKLRRDHDPEQALAILDRHRAELGAGALAAEVTATRIEVLLELGRNVQALALLDTRRLSARGVEREMLVARAELRADKGRITAALRDFDQLLSAGRQSDGVAERARYGRAACRAQSGDWDGARSDFETYLAEFPQGRFAEQAHAALAPRLR